MDFLDPKADYYSCIKLKYPGISDSDFLLEYSEGTLTLNWYNPAFGSKPEFSDLDKVWFNIVKAEVLILIKNLRSKKLDSLVVGPGLLSLYTINFEAASKFLAGYTQDIIKTGVTAESHLSKLATPLGFTAEVFARYIIAETDKITDISFDIEHAYLEFRKNVEKLTTVEQLFVEVEKFKNICN
jgi:hypothetical protein